MSGDQENFPTAGENHNYVCIEESHSQLSHIFLGSKHLVKAFTRGNLIDKDNLSPILDHAMTRKAWEGKDSLKWITLKELVQLNDKSVALF